jgi:hypothetical protein
MTELDMNDIPKEMIQACALVPFAKFSLMSYNICSSDNLENTPLSLKNRIPEIVKNISYPRIFDSALWGVAGDVIPRID